MAKKLFDRKDPTVKADAIALSEEEFVTKYTTETTADKLSATAVHKHFAKEREIAGNVEKVAETATDLFPVHTHISTDDGDKVQVKKSKKSGKTIVEVTSSPESEKEAEQVSPKATKGDKPGRTPRMRELIKEIGKDKPKVKKALEDEGFNTEGSGFHSEWNRVSKAK